MSDPSSTLPKKSIGPDPPPPDLILSSRSPRRRELIRLLRIPFSTAAADVEEETRERERPAETAARLAQAKARAVAIHHPHGLVVGCDTLVALEGEVLGKPVDEAEALAMLRRLRGRTHSVYTGVALIGPEKRIVEVAETRVRMREYTAAELTAYVASGDPLDKAGAYAIQHAAFHPVASWEGCYANVMGLPLCHLARALKGWGILPQSPLPAACQAYTGERCSISPPRGV